VVLGATEDRKLGDENVLESPGIDAVAKVPVRPLAFAKVEVDVPPLKPMLVVDVRAADATVPEVDRQGAEIALREGAAAIER